MAENGGIYLDSELVVSRVEEKYDLSILSAAILKSKLEATLQPDKNNKEDGYTIKSLYFDTINFDDYKDKRDGIENRRKIRLRYYDNDYDFIKLERKYKEGNYQFKQSLLITKDEAIKMMNCDYKFLLEKNSKFASELYAIMTKEHYVPRIVIEYKRNAFIVDSNDIRITLDSNISYSAFTNDFFDPNIAMVPIGLETVLEVKYNNFLYDYVKDIINFSDKLKISISKYELSCNSCFEF